MLKLKAQARLRLKQQTPSAIGQGAEAASQPKPNKGINFDQPGFQQTTDPESGRKSTSLVIPEPFANSPISPLSFNPLTGEGAFNTAKMLGGIGNEVAKGVAGFGEYVLDNMQQSAQDKNEQGIPSIGPDQLLLQLTNWGNAISGNNGDLEQQRATNWVDENWASVAHENQLAQAAQDIGAVVTGGLTPAALTKWGKAGQLTQQFIQKNGPAKALEFFKGMVLGFGKGAPAASIGATMVTPEHMESVSQNGLGPVSGFIPKEIPGMSHTESATVGNFVDNVIGNNIFVGLGQVAKGIGVLGRKIGLLPAGAIDESTEAIEWLKKIDQTIPENANANDLAQRASIMANLLRQNSSQTMNIGNVASADIAQDTLSTVQRVAKQYLDIIYQSRKTTMTPEAYDAFINREAEVMAQGMVDFKRSRLGSPLVRASDADIARQSGNLMSKAADTLATTDQANAVGINFGQGIADTANAGKSDMTFAKAKAKADQSSLNYEAENNYVTKQLQDAQSKGKLSLTDEPFMQGINSLTGPKLLQSRNLAREGVDKAYDSIPAGVEIPDENIDDIIEIITNYGDQDELGKLLGIQLPKKGARDIQLPFDPKKPSVREEALAKLKEDIKGFDFKHIYNVTRPRLARLINSMETAGKMQGADVDYSGLVTLKNYIDGPLTDALAEVNPAVANARDTFKKYANMYRSTPELAEYDELAGLVKSMDDYRPKGESEAFRQGAKLLETLDGGLPGDVASVLKVLTSAKPTASADIANMRLLSGLNVLHRLNKGGGPVNVDQIISAMQPNMVVIRNTNPQMAYRINSVFNSLRKAQGNAQASENAFKEAEKVYDEFIAEVQDTAAARFVDNLMGEGGVGASVSSNPQAAWQEIFSNKNSVVLVRQLLREATQTGATMAVRGIKAQALRYLRGKWAANKPIAFDEGGESFVRDPSGAQLNRSLNPALSNDMALLNEVYDPQTAGGIQAIAEMLSNNSNLAQLGVRGSNSTTVEKSLIQARQMTSRLITIFFGVLNRPAAILRGITGGFVDVSAAARDKILNAILDMQVVDPNFLAKSLDAYARGDTRTLESLGEQLGRRMAIGYGTEKKEELGPDPNAPKPELDWQMNTAFNNSGR